MSRLTQYGEVAKNHTLRFTPKHWEQLQKMADKKGQSITVFLVKKLKLDSLSQ